MAMSKKDFEAMAEAFRPIIGEQNALIASDPDRLYDDGTVRLNACVVRCADYFRSSNPRFIRSRFYEACGLTATGEWPAVEDDASN